MSKDRKKSSFGKHQRANKAEREEQRRVLEAIFKKVYTEGVFTITFPEDVLENARRKIISMYDALCTYRRYVRNHKSENWERWLMVSASQIKRPDELTIKIERKTHRMSNRTALIMEVGKAIPELAITNEANPVEDIMKDFKKLESENS